MYLKIVYIMMGDSGVHICNVISLCVHVKLTDISPPYLSDMMSRRKCREGEEGEGEGCSFLQLPHLAAHA